MSRKRFREDEEDSFGRHPPTPSTTPPGSTHSFPKRQRVVSPDAWDASIRPAQAGYLREPGFDLFSTSSNGALSEESQGPGHNKPYASGPGVRVSIINRDARESGPPATISRVESVGDSGKDEENYDPEDVDSFEWESSSDGDDIGSRIEFSQNPLQLDVTSAPAPLAPINALLHDLHAQRQLVSRQRHVSGSASHIASPRITSGAGSKLTIHPSARADAPPPPSTHWAAVETIPDPESVECEKAIVTARYEETNRLLGSLFLSRRRPPSQLGNEDN